MLLDYLEGYIRRIKPLLDINLEMENVSKEFYSQWEAGTFPGWPVSIQIKLINFISSFLKI